MPLTGAAFILLCGAVSSQAAFLNDIRVGDYKDHTRIVLELSSAMGIERITPLLPGQLTIILPATQPRLVRKIPIEHSQHVKDIRLWYSKENFTVRLTFAFDHFRYKVIKFKNPDRIAVDVYQLASAPLTPMPEKNKDESIVTPNVAEAEKQLPMIGDNSNPFQPPASTERLPQMGALEKQATQPKKGHTADEVRRPWPPNPVAQKKAGGAVVSAPPKQHASPDALPDTSSGSRGLQFYLVVGLVMLTIFILVLLLLMLLMKQRWISGETPLNATEYLQRQDKRIAALDTQIQEQLKRYDEA